MWAAALALFAALCWGVAPIFGKWGLERTDPATGLAARTLAAASLMGAWTLASGHMAEVQQIPPRAWGLIALEGLLGTVVGDLAYYASLKWGEAGAVSLVMAASPLVTLLLGLALVGEVLTLRTAAGAALIIVGLVLLSIGGNPGGPQEGPRGRGWGVPHAGRKAREPPRIEGLGLPGQRGAGPGSGPLPGRRWFLR